MVKKGQRQDVYNFLSKLTVKKAINVVKVFSSFYFSKYIKKVYHKGHPISISFEPTTSCNLRCPECPSGLRSFTRPTGMLDQHLFEKTIDQLKDKLCYLTFYFQGEPFLNPKFLDMVKFASSKKIYTATSTNAHYLNDETARKTVLSGLDRIIISIDGSTQEVYEQYRKGGKLETVLNGVENLQKWKKELKSATPYIIFQFLVVKPNEHQIKDIYSLASLMAADEVKLKTAQIYNYENGSPLIPAQSRYSRYKLKGNGKWTIKGKLENNCWKMWHSCVITWDGSILPCCFDKDGQYKLGNVKIEGFLSAWNSEDYNTFRKTLLQSREQIPICQNCTEGTKVWA